MTTHDPADPDVSRRSTPLVVTLLIAAMLFIPACRESEPPPSEPFRTVDEPTPVVTAPAAAPAPATAPMTAPPSEATIPATTMPATTMPVPSRPAVTDRDPAVAEFLGFAAPKPAVWKRYPAENRMRAANWVVPGASGQGQAHLVVFQGIGGDVDANIVRWRAQFRTAEGGPVEETREDFEVAGLPVTVVELVGQHMRSGAAWFTPDQCMLAAVVQTSGTPIHITLTGPRETVQSSREAFMTLIRGLDRSGAAR